MNSTEEQYLDIADNDWKPLQLPLDQIKAKLWMRRRFLAVVTAVGILLSLGIAFLIPNEYTSTTSIMPPDQQTFTNVSMLNALSGMNLLSSGMTGGFLSQRTPGQTAIGILSSRTVQDDIIHRFDLRAVYHEKYEFEARKKLLKRTSFDEDKKNGIVSITVMDRDRNRARDIAAAYIEELDKLATNLSTSAAGRERVFLEQRLKSIKEGLDADSVALSQFSSRNATLDIQRQGQAEMEAATRLQGQLIAAQTELSGLKIGDTDENPQVRVLEARIVELKGQLRLMSGTGQNMDAPDLNGDQMLPSLRKLPLLGVTYLELYRRVLMQETLYETLSKQYELAKVEEAKELPPIKVLDAPDVPERKSAPHRAIIVLCCTLLSLLGAIAWILYPRKHATELERAQA